MKRSFDPENVKDLREISIRTSDGLSWKSVALCLDYEKISKNIALQKSLKKTYKSIVNFHLCSVSLVSHPAHNSLFSSFSNREI
jgi:hypothetical protein